MKKYWYDMHLRGLESVAVWQTHAPLYKFGEVTLGAHGADVNLLNDHLQQCHDGEDALDMARLARDNGVAAIRDLCTRACQAVLGHLPVGDALRGEVSDVRRVASRSQQGVLDKGRKLVSLWQMVNTHRAQMTPAQPALLVGETEAGSFQSSLGNHAQILQDVEHKLAAFNKKKNQLRATATRVDKNNKRWFEAWKGQFARGTPERAALRQISTSPGQTIPGQAAVLVTEQLPGRVVRLAFDAARATQFTLLHRAPGETAFSVLADELTAKTFDHTATVAGAHTYKVIGRNSAGVGAESAAIVVTVAEQVAA